MMVLLAVTLYTSRVILQKLGVEDYGIYQAVGGIVGFLSFINSALATGSSRFITYALGEGSEDKLRRTFSTTLTVHILLAIFIVIIAETIGLWFLHEKLVIPEERLDAAILTYHLSIITAVFTIIQVPFNATIIAHERMSIFAYVSIVDAFMRLGVCYLVGIGNFDNLKMYALLLAFTQIALVLFYYLYCKKCFYEARFLLTFDKKIFKEIAGFSGWSLFSNAAGALNNQGVLILLNMFFSPAVVTARSLSLQVDAAANQFLLNFRQAANPQIVKKYASGDYEGSKKLLLDSTKFSFFLMFIICLPIFLLAKQILTLWLDIVPEYTVPFLKIVIVQSLFHVFDTSFYTALYANGQLKQNALISPTVLFLLFPVVYFLFKLGYSPLVLSYGAMICYMILGCVVKPILLVKIMNYKWRDFYDVFKPCVLVATLSFPIPYLLTILFDADILINSIAILLVSVIFTTIIIWFVGINKSMRQRVICYLKQKVHC